MKNLIWFRQDLRLSDNRALSDAAKNTADGLIALFISTPDTWKKHHFSAAKVDLILRQLATLKTDCEKLNIPFKYLEVPKYSDVPTAIQTICEQFEIQAVYANEQPLLDEQARDQAVQKALQSIQVDFHLAQDLTVLNPKCLTKKDGTPYQVFTPYKKVWLAKVDETDWALSPKVSKQKSLQLSSDEIPTALSAFKPYIESNWLAGEKAVQKTLKQFCNEQVMQYQIQRDFPSLAATSHLSPYLAIGVVSVRQCIHALMTALNATTLSQVNLEEGPSTWLSELIWREFYQAICCHFPDVVKGAPFKPITDYLPWSNNSDHFKAWCEGKTGFPLVDAAMRQLNQTSWMHNRLRMVVAMFLTKTLFIHWRKGERYFMENLIDGDFPANNGGWQWSASTGTDAAPYFRIFNPTSQSEKFDKNGDFIREFCPELKDLDNKSIHNPNPMERQLCGYPEPIVDYSKMRQHVIEAFKALKEIP